MIKAVIFDMYETLITQYGGPVYFRAQMAVNAIQSIANKIIRTIFKISITHTSCR